MGLLRRPDLVSLSSEDILKMHLMIDERRKRGDMKMTWKCPMCGHENPDTSELCEVCGTYRDEPAYDTIADIGDEGNN